MSEVNAIAVPAPVTGRRIELPLLVRDCGGCQSTVDEWTETLWGELGVVRTERDRIDDERRQHQDSERRLRERFRNLTTTPELTRVPGLDLAARYEPASNAADEGGDFRDVFPLGDGRYALIVGEVSGGGEAAADQACALRHYLRFALASNSSLGTAVTQVNHICVSQGLFEDFATLFAAIYNARTGTLFYVNARQEPALLRRGNNDKVELLAATGSCLGATELEPFAERATTLNVSDTLAIFTDGLTEQAPRCNPSLGVARLIQRLCRGESCGAGRRAACLLADARGGAASERFHDDASLIVAIRTGPNF